MVIPKVYEILGLMLLMLTLKAAQIKKQPAAENLSSHNVYTDEFQNFDIYLNCINNEVTKSLTHRQQFTENHD